MDKIIQIKKLFVKEDTQNHQKIYIMREKIIINIVVFVQGKE